MADGKKYNGSTWEHSLRKLGTSTDTLTTLPAVLYPNDTTATVGLKGDMSQSSQPSPTTPIQPSECGELTSNLLNPVPYKEGYYINENGIEVQATRLFNIWAMSNVYSGQTYTISCNTELSGSQVRVHAYYNGAWSEQITYKGIGTLPLTFTIPSNCNEVRISTTSSATGHLMLNTGETALPYEPYGIKIPISSANTTTPVYLGEVQTTRKIKKLVLTGQESWQELAVGSKTAYYISLTSYALASASVICTHLVSSKIAFSSVGNAIRFFVSDNFATLGDWEQFIAQQYSAGTPVTVWYVLTTEPTGILNEPLRKIGDYADTVSGITIPTTTGKDSFDVLTTLKPSEVSLAYTGWHDASAKEWDGSEWQ